MWLVQRLERCPPAKAWKSTVPGSKARTWNKAGNGRLGHMPKMSATAKLRLALDMYGFGEQAERARLRRLRPGAPHEEIEAAIRAWRMSRPGAFNG